MTKELLPPNVPILLDGKPVEKITAFLVDKGGNDDPYKLLANERKSFQGSIVLGMGFTFDDSNPNATPISEMHGLIEENPKNQEVIFPYIGGSEVNSSPTHAYHRYVINFGEMTEKEAKDNYPDLMAIVEEKVKPSRVSLPPKNNWNRTVAKKWWLFGADRIELKKAIALRDRVLVRSLTSKHFCFTFLKHDYVYDQTLIVFALPHFSTFTILSSRVHKVWANFFGASLEDRPRYNVADCFQTFPFPKNWETDPTLEQIGETYYTFRADLMVRNNEGLTDTYNRFHNPDETDSDILQLRQLHDSLDQAVLNAYGWNDITPTCEFLLDYEEEDDNSDRKKPYRYRWNNEFQDEILARLLALNKQRHEEETLRGETGKKTTQSRGKKKKQTSDSLNLDYS